MLINLFNNIGYGWTIIHIIARSFYYIICNLISFSFVESLWLSMNSTWQTIILKSNLTCLTTVDTQWSILYSSNRYFGHEFGTVNKDYTTKFVDETFICGWWTRMVHSIWPDSLARDVVQLGRCMHIRLCLVPLYIDMQKMLSRTIGNEIVALKKLINKKREFQT